MVSVIIPVHINSLEILNLLSSCVQSLNGADEIIIQFDNECEGFSKTVNKGVLRSKYDYIAIVNDDTKMLNGTLKDYCKENTIVRPTLIGGYGKFAFVVMPKKVWDKVGGLDEDFKIGFYEDKLFLDKAKSLGVNIEYSPFEVWHKGSATIGEMNPKELMKINKQIYENKKNN